MFDIISICGVNIFNLFLLNVMLIFIELEYNILLVFIKYICCVLFLILIVDILFVIYLN